MCDVCNKPFCPGTQVLRHFDSWIDLTTHLSEARVVEIVNRLDSIWDEYKELRDNAHNAEFEARAKKAKLVNTREGIDRLLKAFTPEEIKALLPQQAEEQKHEDPNPCGLNRKARRAQAQARK